MRTDTSSAWAPASPSLDLRDTPSLASITAKVAATRGRPGAGRWIVGRGWDQNDWPVKEWPTRQDLDAVAPDTPVLLDRIDGHAAWANSKALALAGITAATRDPDGGRLLRDAGRRADRRAHRHRAAAGRTAHPADRRPREIDEQILAADRETRRLGLTMVHDAGASSAHHRGLSPAEPARDGWPRAST